MANSTKKIVTPVFRASFVNVLKPRLNEQSGKEEYSIKMIFDKDADLSPLAEIVQEAIKNKWGNNPPKGLKLPVKDGNESDLDKYPEDKDKWVANAKTVLTQPGIVNRQLEPITDPKEIYSGCYMRASLTAYAYDNKSKGVSFGLQNLIKWEDGEPLSPKATAEEDFKEFREASAVSQTDAASILGI